MREFIICFPLWCKRFFKHPFFVFTLFLMPLSVFFLKYSQRPGDAFVQVALFAPKENSDSVTTDVIQKMLSLSNTSIRFYLCDSKDKLQRDVMEGKAACGYLFPENLEQKLEQYAKDRTPFLHVIQPQKDARTNIVDEIVLSSLYQPVSYYMLTHFLSEKWDISSEKDWLHETFVKHSSSELLFHFEYADGTENNLLNDKNTNYMLMPVRGIVAVIVLLICLAGGLSCYEDSLGPFLLMDTRKKSLCILLSLLTPAFFAGIAGLITIKMTGITVSFTIEIPAMLLYLLCCMGLTNLLRVVCCRELYLAAIPLFTAGSLIISPVFFNLADRFPVLHPVSSLLPATHYLNSIYNPSASFSLFLFFFFSCSLSVSYSRIKG